MFSFLGSLSDSSKPNPLFEKLSLWLILCWFFEFMEFLWWKIFRHQREPLHHWIIAKEQEQNSVDFNYFWDDEFFIQILNFPYYCLSWNPAGQESRAHLTNISSTTSDLYFFWRRGEESYMVQLNLYISWEILLFVGTK